MLARHTVGRIAALVAILVPLFPVVRVGFQPYRPFLLARRVAAMRDLMAVHPALGWLLDALVVASLAAVTVVIARGRVWRPITGTVGGILLVLLTTLGVIAGQTVMLKLEPGAYVALLGALTMVISALWPARHAPARSGGTADPRLQ